MNCSFWHGLKKILNSFIVCKGAGTNSQSVFEIWWTNNNQIQSLVWLWLKWSQINGSIYFIIRDSFNCSIMDTILLLCEIFQADSKAISNLSLSLSSLQSLNYLYSKGYLVIYIKVIFLLPALLLVWIVVAEPYRFLPIIGRITRSYLHWWDLSVSLNSSREPGE